VRLQVLSCLRPGRKTDTKNNVRGHKGEESERGTFFGGPGRGRPRLLLLRTAGRCAERHYCFRRSLRAGGPPPPPLGHTLHQEALGAACEPEARPLLLLGESKRRWLGEGLTRAGFSRGGLVVVCWGGV